MLQLRDLTYRERIKGFKALEQAGIDAARWIEMSNADPQTLKALVAHWPAPLGYAFDSVHMLGFGEKYNGIFPSVPTGGIIIRYGGWSLKQICESAIGRRLINVRNPNDYERFSWYSKSYQPGLYHMRLPVPGTRSGSFQRKLNSLQKDERLAPAVLLITAMICHMIITGEGFMLNHNFLCRERGWNLSRLMIGSACDRLQLWLYRKKAYIRSRSTWIASSRIIQA